MAVERLVAHEQGCLAVQVVVEQALAMLAVLVLLGRVSLVERVTQLPQLLMALVPVVVLARLVKTAYRQGVETVVPVLLRQLRVRLWVAPAVAVVVLVILVLRAELGQTVAETVKPVQHLTQRLGL